MIRKALGFVLMAVALVITFALVTGGGTLVPHIGGPIVLAIAGMALIAYRRKPANIAE